MKIMNMKKIGILGGLGPASTIYFYQGLIQKMQKEKGAKYNYDFPYMVIVNVPVSDTILATDFDSNSTKKELLKAVAFLEKAVDFIVIPCNTAHIFYKDIVESITVPVVNIIEETDKAIKKSGDKNLVLLSSEPTFESNLYQNASQGLYNVHHPMKQENVTKAIHNIMGGTIQTSDSSNLLYEVTEAKKRGCTGIILGCTELPVIFDKLQVNRPNVFDSSTILMDKTMRWAYNEE